MHVFSWLWLVLLSRRKIFIIVRSSCDTVRCLIEASLLKANNSWNSCRKVYPLKLRSRHCGGKELKATFPNDTGGGFVVMELLLSAVEVRRGFLELQARQQIRHFPWIRAQWTSSMCRLRAAEDFAAAGTLDVWSSSANWKLRSKLIPIKPAYPKTYASSWAWEDIIDEAASSSASESRLRQLEIASGKVWGLSSTHDLK